MYLLYEGDMKRILAACAGAWLFEVLPAVAFLAMCLPLALERASTPIALAVGACFLLAVLRQWSYSRALRRLGFDARLASYQVPGALLFGLVLANSTWAHRLAGHVRWKGREYSTKVKP